MWILLAAAITAILILTQTPSTQPFTKPTTKPTIEPTTKKNKEIKNEKKDNNHMKIILGTIGAFNFEDIDDNKKAIEIIKEAGYHLSTKPSGHFTNDDVQQIFKNAMIQLATHYDDIGKTSKDEGAVIMSFTWLWSQMFYKDEALKVQQFLGKYLPAAFLYGGFANVTRRLFKEYDVK